MALFCLLVSVCNDGVSPHNQEGLEKETRDAPKWSAAIIFLIKPVLLLGYVKKKSIKLFHLKFKYGVIKTIVYVYT